MAFSPIPGFQTLFSDVNKPGSSDSDETKQGVISPALPELTLDKSDEELLESAKTWTTRWGAVQVELSRKQKQNEQYWLGKHFGFTDFQSVEDNIRGRPNVDNLTFENVETWLPMATKKNPDPDVSADDTQEGYRISYAVQKHLATLADRTGLKLVLKGAARNWLLAYLGVIKVGWDFTKNEITHLSIRPQKLILDPDATILNGEYTGSYIGQYEESTASVLADKYPDKSKELMKLAKNEGGTKLRYVEWWTPEMVFWTLGDLVLGKVKNPHWNYDTEIETVDEFGNPKMVPAQGFNHFPVPKMPYCFLSVFSTGKHPFDDTSLVEQNLNAQDRINKRLKQIDRNVDSMNGANILSGDAFSEEQAANADEAIRKGSSIWTPKGNPTLAVHKVTGIGLPADVYRDLDDIRTEMKSNFGVLGSSASGIEQEKTVRGKLIIKAQDGDRIGGGFTEYLEKLAEQVYNWDVQLMLVYYDEPHTSAFLGKQRATEFVSLKNTDLNKKLTVTVKEGSLVPRDTMSRRAEAMELWASNGIDPISFYEALEMPNPREMAKSLYLWQSNPASLFPELAPPAPVMGQPAPMEAPQEVPLAPEAPQMDILNSMLG